MTTSFASRLSCCLIVMLLAAAGRAPAAQQLWTLPLKEEAKWHTLTELGVLLVGTDSAIHCIDPESGREMWRREEFKKSTVFNAREIPGTPFLVCNTYSGIMATRTTLHFINYLEGKSIWTSPEIMGQYLATIPVPQKGLVVLVMNMIPQGGDDLSGIALLGFDLGTGKARWRAKFAKSGAIPLHMADGSGRFLPTFDLSGYHDPLIEGDNLYLPYLGIHCVDLNTGATKWGVEFPTGAKGYKKTNSPLRIDGDIIYGSGGGSLYAVNKLTGVQLWSSDRISNFGGLLKARHNAIVAQIEPVGGKIFMRFGGNFSNGQTVTLLEPLGVAVLDQQTGKLLSEHEAKEGVTNLMVLPELNAVMYADAYNLYGIDTAGPAGAEIFRVPIEFKRKMGGGEVAQLGLGALGGVSGLLKAGFAQSKARLDVPMLISRRDGRIVVQGRQHLMAFDPALKNIKWSTYCPAPGGGIGTYVMFALTAAQGLAGNAQVAASGGVGTSGWSSGVDTIHGGLDNYNSYRARQGAAHTASGTARSYLLTSVEDGKEKGVGLLGIDLGSGDPAKKLILGTKEPEYQVDEAADRIFFFKDKDTIVAYQL